MVGQVTPLADDRFNFKLAGDNPSDPGLTFAHKSLRLDHNLRCLPALGVRGDPHGQFARFDGALHVDIPKCQLFFRQGKSYLAGLARGEGYFLESFQFPDRTGDARPAWPI